MRKILQYIVIGFALITLSGCYNTTQPEIAKKFTPKQVQDVQIFSVDNSDGKITKETIEAAFKQEGFTIDGNNNMNAPFEKRFKSTTYKMYRLMFVHNAKLVAQLAKDYPSIGLIAPLSTSVYMKDNKMHIATLTLDGMAKITGISKTNKTLQAISKNLNQALVLALPNGSFEPLDFKIKNPQGALVTHFETEIEGDDLEEEKEGFQEEMEGELEPVGFIIAGFVNLNDEFHVNKTDIYDFYDTYSICKLDVIHPVHQLHPEVGAFAPCTLYMYKKKGEEKTHIAFPSVRNWISSTNIEDKKSLQPLYKAQELLEQILGDLVE